MPFPNHRFTEFALSHSGTHEEYKRFAIITTCDKFGQYGLGETSF